MLLFLLYMFYKTFNKNRIYRVIKCSSYVYKTRKSKMNKYIMKSSVSLSADLFINICNHTDKFDCTEVVSNYILHYMLCNFIASLMEEHT